MVSHRLYVLIIALMAVIAVSSSRADDTLNPATYASPDGSWSVHVEPATKNGDAGAAYVVKHHGAQVWAKDLPFALWEAAITDTGVVAGVAYEHGLDGGAYPKPDTGHSYLYAIIIDEAGNIRLQDGRPRKGAAVYTNPPSPLEPTASGVIADPLSDTFVIRIPPGFFEQSYTWWRYRLSTGEKLDDVLPDQPKEPDEHGFHKEINVLQVSDAPLVLIHWHAAHFARKDSTNGASIHVTDLNGKDVWRLDLPREYDALGDDWHWYYDLVEQGIKQVELTGRRFTVRSYRLGEQIEYAISGDAADGWSVKEVGRSPDKLPVVNREVEPQLESPLVTLKLLGTIKLGGSADLPPEIDDIRGFSLDEHNNIGFIRSDSGTPREFLLVSPEGAVLQRWPLAGAKPFVAEQAVWLEPGKWLVYATGLGDDPAGACLLDIETGGLTTLPVELGGIKTACRTSAGGFAVIGGVDWVNASTLVAFDRDGHRLWSTDLFSPEDVACTSTGQIVALENITNKLTYFSADGADPRELELRQVIGRDPEYPTGLTADVEGGVIVYDFAGKPSIRRISAEGKAVDGFTPRYEDGRTFSLRGNVQRAADGSLWTSDGHALLRLDEKGVVDRVVGTQPGEGSLVRVSGVTIGPDGRIYAANERDSRIHVFDSKGNSVKMLKPDPDDFSVESPCSSISISGNGDIYCQRSGWRSNGVISGYVHFDSQGQRIGFEPCKFDLISEEWLFKPGAGARWMLGYKKIALTDENGNITRTIDKLPSGDWLEQVGGGGAAPDGSLAVLASSDSGMRGPATINVYNSDGEPVCTLPCPGRWIPYEIAFNGPVIVTCRGSELQFHYLDGRPATHAKLPVEEGKQDFWYVYFNPDGSELWARNADALEFLRFEVP